MAQTVCPLVSAEDRARLAAIVADRNRPQKHAARARIILHSAERLDVAEVARRAGISRPAVWRWQQRFAEAGVDGLLRDKTRKPGKPPHARGDRAAGGGADLRRAAGRGDALDRPGDGQGDRALVALGAAHLGRAPAPAAPPAHLQALARSGLLAKLADIVGLYLAPPRHAVVLSVDEKSQIQALDRTQPGLPLKPGKAGTMTHDYMRHGTTTLFAALNVLDGTVLGRCMQRHRHQEFIRFLNAVEAAVPAGKLIHAILDNYATHKHPKVLAWLERHPRWTFHFTPTSGSWLNAVETFFSAMTRRRLRRGVFRSIVDLQAAINRYLAEHNADPKPFVWTATPRRSSPSWII